MQSLKLFFVLGASALLGGHALVLNRNELVKNDLNLFKNDFHKNLGKSLIKKDSIFKRQGVETCTFPIGDKTITEAFDTPAEFYDNTDAPVIIPCNGYYFSIAYQTDQVNNNYLWITDSNGPFVDNGINMELTINDGKPEAYFGETIGLGNIAVGQDEYYQIQITGDSNGLMFYFENRNVLNITAADSNYQQYFQNGPKHAYIGGGAVGQVISNIIVTCNNYDTACSASSSSTEESSTEESSTEESSTEESSTDESSTDESSTEESSTEESSTEESSTEESSTEESSTEESSTEESSTEESSTE
ncbi:hypothetical protein AYI68_g6455, partial [Smittium mucronatum]